MKEAKVTYTLEMDDKFIIIENVPASARGNRRTVLFAGNRSCGERHGV